MKVEIDTETDAPLYYHEVGEILRKWFEQEKRINGLAMATCSALAMLHGAISRETEKEKKNEVPSNAKAAE